MSSSPWRAAVLVAVPYLLFAVAWIVFSDRVVELTSGDLRQAMELQTVKGLAFVLLSSLLIFVLVYLAQRRAHRLHMQRLRSELELSRLLESVNDGVWTIDAASRRVIWRGNWPALTGYDADDLSSVTVWLRHIHQDDQGGFSDQLDALLTGAMPRLMHEHRIQAANGQWLSMRAQARGVAGANPAEEDGDRWVVGTYTDLTALRAQEQRLSALAQDLGDARAELDALASAAAHDLRQPVREVASYVQLLNRRLGPDLPVEACEDMGYLVSAAQHLESLLDGLLQAVETARANVSFEAVALTPVVEERVRLHAGDLKACGGTVVVGDLPEVRGDAGQLTLLFDALLSNAIKFRSADRPLRVEISATRDGPWWRIVVADNGIGLPGDHVEEIFLAFRRLHGRGEYQGGGMGLAVCRSIAVHHGGTIHAAGTPGDGARFILSLPAQPMGTAASRITLDGASDA